jgi:hypothetical protein
VAIILMIVGMELFGLPAVFAGLRADAPNDAGGSS